MTEVTEHTVLGGKLTLRQPAEGYRAAIDPVLLAAAIPAKPGEQVLELGTGIGTAALCLLTRCSGVNVVGVDIQDELIALAQTNAKENNLVAHARFFTADINDLSACLAGDRFDHVIANPPWFQASHAQASPNSIKAIANVEGEGGLGAWLSATRKYLKPGGMLTLVHTADRLTDITEEITIHQLGSVEIFPLWPKQGRPAKRVIVRCRQGGKAATILHAGLVLHERSGVYAIAADQILKEAEKLMFAEDQALNT